MLMVICIFVQNVGMNGMLLLGDVVAADDVLSVKDASGNLLVMVIVLP